MSAPTVLDGAVVLGMLGGIIAWAGASPEASVLFLAADLALVLVDLLMLVVVLDHVGWRA